MSKISLFIWTWLLLKVGADMHAKKKDGSTRLHVAARRESPRVVSMLC